VLVIIYGSLYPWHFVARHLDQNPFQILLHSWHTRVDEFMFRDLVVNVAVYFPLGMAAHLVLLRYGKRWLSLVGPVLLALVLSCSMEMLQIFDPIRYTSLVDVINNVAGAALGVIAGLVFDHIAVPALRTPRDRSAVSLLFLWAGYHLFPMFPAVGLYGPARKFALFLETPVFDLSMVVGMAAIWFAAGRLLQAVDVRSPARWLATALGLLPAQFFIVERQPTPSGFIGAAAGVALFLVLRNRRGFEAPLFVLALVVRGLAPFHFEAAASAFSWAPFSGFLESEWRVSILLFLEKSLYYAIAIWLVRASGVRLVRATALVAVVLLGIEVAQRHLPGRTSEITDPLLAVMMGYGLGMMRRVEASA
jgi:VanZ family protein